MHEYGRSKKTIKSDGRGSPIGKARDFSSVCHGSDPRPGCSPPTRWIGASSDRLKDISHALPARKNVKQKSWDINTQDSLIAALLAMIVTNP